MKKRRKSLLMMIAVCAFAVYIAATLVNQTIQIRKSDSELATLKSQVVDQQKQNAETQRMLNENDGQFMENVAENSLGYAKPNERIFVDASGN
jgi:cell division protein FtsL